MPVEGLPIVVARWLIGYPRLEIGMGGVRVIVLVILAVIPLVPLMGVAVRGLPPVVDMDPVPLLAVEGLLLVFGIVVITPLSVRGLLAAVILGAIWFAVLEVRIGVVVLGVLVSLMRSRLPGQDRRSHEHHCRQQPQKQHQSSQLFFSFPKQVPTFSLQLELITSFHRGGARQPCRVLPNTASLANSDELAMNSWITSKNFTSSILSLAPVERPRRCTLSVSTPTRELEGGSAGVYKEAKKAVQKVIRKKTTTKAATIPKHPPNPIPKALPNIPRLRSCWVCWDVPAPESGGTSTLACGVLTCAVS